MSRAFDPVVFIEVIKDNLPSTLRNVIEICCMQNFYIISCKMIDHTVKEFGIKYKKCLKEKRRSVPEC